MNSVQMSISSSSDILIKIFWDHLCIIFYQQKAPQIKFDIYRLLAMPRVETRESENDK